MVILGCDFTIGNGKPFMADVFFLHCTRTYTVHTGMYIHAYSTCTRGQTPRVFLIKLSETQRLHGNEDTYCHVSTMPDISIVYTSTESVSEAVFHHVGL